jgi:tetratricopeptide (TPR) repeat protein
VIRSDAHKLLVAACEIRSDWIGARTHLVTLLESDPKNGPHRQRLARALFYLDKTNDAFKELTTAVKDDATLEPAAVTMGQLWSGKGDSKQARAWLDQAVKAEPNSLRVHLAYAKWLLEQNEIDPAKVHLDASAKLRPEDTDVLKLQGLVARIKKDFAAAEKVFRKINTDTPDDFFASNQLALTLADQADNDQRKRALQYAAVNARQFAHTPDPRAVESLATLGYVNYRNNNLEDAWQSIQAATSGGQASSDTAYFLAMMLTERDKNKSEDAKRILKTALESRGLFVYRKDAQTLLDKLDRKEPVKDAKTTAAGKDRR